MSTATPQGVWIEKPLLIEAKRRALREGVSEAALVSGYCTVLLDQLKQGRRVGQIPSVDVVYLKRNASKMVKLPGKLYLAVSDEAKRRDVTIRALVTFALREGLHGAGALGDLSTPTVKTVNKSATGLTSALRRGADTKEVIRVEGDLKNALKATADDVGVSMVGLVSEVLREVVDNPEANQEMLARIGERLLGAQKRD